MRKVLGQAGDWGATTPVLQKQLGTEEFFASGLKRQAARRLDRESSPEQDQQTTNFPRSAMT